MKIKLKKTHIREGKWYSGVVTRQYEIDSRLRIFVELDDAPGTEYMQSIKIDDNSNSSFASFARKMDIVDKNGEIDTDLLEGLAVKVTMHFTKDGSIFIKDMLIDDDYYDDMEDSDEGAD